MARISDLIAQESEYVNNSYQEKREFHARTLAALMEARYWELRASAEAEQHRVKLETMKLEHYREVKRG